MRIIRLKCDGCGKYVTQKDYLHVKHMELESKERMNPAGRIDAGDIHVCSSSCWRKVMDRIYKEHTENLRFWKKGKK